MSDAANELTDQPVFYLFIAATVLLALGYTWGKRRNESIRQTALRALVDAVGPTDKRFVNIGGLTGYHAVLTPPDGDGFAAVEATVLLLARHAWLYLPFSLLLRRQDRLYLSLTIAQGAPPIDAEAHLIARAYAHSAEGRIVNAPELQVEELDWGGESFLLYFGTGQARARMSRLRKRLPQPGPLRHVALVPERQRIHAMLVPQPDGLAHVLREFYQWARLAATEIETRLRG